MRILLIYPGHVMSTKDVASGYEAALRELGHTVYAYNLHDTLAFYGAAFSHWSENSDYIYRDSDPLAMAAENVIIRVIEFVPDVILLVNGFLFHKRGFELLDRIGIPIVLIATESPYKDDQQCIIANGGKVAAVLVNDKNSLAAFGDIPTRYLPHSYDPARHKPMTVNGEYQSDVFFVGTLWPERQMLLQTLKDNEDGRLYAFGGVYPGERDMQDAIANDEMVKLYNGTKIALNHHRNTIGFNRHKEPQYITPGAAYSIGPRTYEIAATGAFQLCDDTRPELHDLFNSSVPTYKDADDLLGKVDYYLSNENERKERAAASLAAVRDCTFSKRAEQIVIPALSEVID